MPQYNPHKHHRRSIRLKGWDYRQPAFYFVTICTHQRQYMFENQAYYEIAVHTLERIPEQPHAKHVRLGETIIMPNHGHILFEFMDWPAGAAPDYPPPGARQNAPAGSLGVVVGQYKRAVTTRINCLRQCKGAAVWQRGYYERIVRNERELNAIRQYIRNNPARWEQDRDNLDVLLRKMTYRR